jgi:hypothetical protein
MKKYNKQPPKTRVITELAAHFDYDMEITMAVTILPNGALAYKDFVVKQVPSQNWGLYRGKQLIEEFFLKTCALMAAKSYHSVQLNRFFEIKQLDRRYQASYLDGLTFKHNIKGAKDTERYMVLLNKLEYSNEQTTHFKEKISQMFKWSFV